MGEKLIINCWVIEVLDEKKLKEIERKVPIMVQEEEISKNDENKKLVDFYLENASASLNSARILNEVSSQLNPKKQFPFIDDSFEAYLWVINTSYYSMFYMAGALLAKEGIKVRSAIGVHKKTFESLVYYVYLTKKLPKYFLEIFEEAQQESQELLGKDEILSSMQEKTLELMQKYNFELGKRSKFTYQIGEKAKQNKANTSLNRAIEFHNELLQVIKR